jgi:hypothetical protein
MAAFPAFRALRWPVALSLITLGLAAQSPAAEVAPIPLPELTATERGWVADPHSIPTRARLGFGRVVPEGALAAILDAPANWRPTRDGGHRLAVRVTSPGASGLRLGLRVDALPEGATLAVAGTAQAALAPAARSTRISRATRPR